MNESYSRLESYLPRWITPDLRQAVLEHPVVVLTGARQVGKSTLLLHEEPFRHWRFRSMDDFDTLRQAREHPEGLWAGAQEIVLDEVQRLAVFLSGYYSVDDLRRVRERGAFFETMIYHHLRVLARALTPAGRLYFWRTQKGDEVDFVLEHGRRVLAIEVKLDTQPGYRQAEGIQRFLEDNPTASGGLLLYPGREIRWIDEKIMAVPWTLVTG